MDSLFNNLDIEVEPLSVELNTPMFKLVRRGDIDTILENERRHSIKFLESALNG